MHGGLATKKTRYFAPAQEVVVRGVVKPFVPGQVRHALRDPARQGEQEGPPRGRRRGRYEFRFKVGNAGSGAARGEAPRPRRQVAFRTRNETITGAWTGTPARARAG